MPLINIVAVDTFAKRCYDIMTEELETHTHTHTQSFSLKMIENHGKHRAVHGIHTKANKLQKMSNCNVLH